MDVLFHLLLPFLLLLLFGIKLEKKQYFALAFFSILPDFDRLIFLSRQGFHSLFFIAIVLLAFFLLSRKKKDGNLLVGLAAFGLVSHIFFDLGGPLSFFFPLDCTLYQLNIKLLMVKFLPFLSFSIQATNYLQQGSGIILSEQGIAVLVLLAALFAFQKIKQKKKI